MQTNNKYGLNTWGIIIFLLIVLLSSACSDEDFGTDNETGGNAIAFDCSTSNLRASVTTAEDMQYFRVSAVWEKSGGNYEPFMDKQLVEKQNGSWVYSPVKYMPGYGSVSFFAYTPATSSGLKTFHIDNASKRVSIEYAVSTDSQKQEDFMVATCIGEKNNPIQLNFKHALSFVNFRARSSEPGVNFRIKEIQVNDLYRRGIITELNPGENSTWKWDEWLYETNYAVYQKYPFETQDDNFLEVGDLIVLPQKPGANFKIIVSYDILGTTPESKTKEYLLDKDFSFEMGKRYTFFLDLNLNTPPSLRSSHDIRQIDIFYQSVDW